MEILQKLREIFMEASQYVESKNYYFETHNCTQDENRKVKVRMDYEIKDDRTEDIIRIGICPVCKTAFYYSGAE